MAGSRDGASRIRITPSVRPSRQRRRRREERAGCCMLLILGVSLLILVVASHGAWLRWIRARRSHRHDQAIAGLGFPLQVSIPTRPVFYRFDLVPLVVRWLAPDGSAVQGKEPRVRVRRSDGEAVSGTGGVATLPLRYDRRLTAWTGAWPIPPNPRIGSGVWYQFEVSGPVPAGQWRWGARPPTSRPRQPGTRPVVPGPSQAALCTAYQRFHVVGRAPAAKTPPGLCAVIWEDYLSVARGLSRPDGTKGDWPAIFDWAEYLGADAVWFRAAVTDVRDPSVRLTLDQPFVELGDNDLNRLGEEARRRGLKLGVYAMAFETLPEGERSHAATRARKPPYIWTENWSRGRRTTYEQGAVSLLDPNRPVALRRFFERMQQNSNVDFIGLDYVRSGADWGSYELVDEFVRDMPVARPAGWSAWSKQQRMSWLCGKFEGLPGWHANFQLYHQWNWWRAHRMSSILAEQLRAAQVEKPVWTFLFSWWHGEQSGQDPLMFADAGIDIAAPMVYNIAAAGYRSPHAAFENVLGQWSRYLRPGQVYLVPGNEVRDAAQHRTRNPAAPEELYNRLVACAGQMTPGAPSQGLFWHDISRAATKGPDYLGPYPPREWGLAGAAAFSRLRELCNVQPLRAAIQPPGTTVTIGATAEYGVAVTNLTRKEMRNIEVHFEPSDGVVCTGSVGQAVRSLGPEQTVTVPLRVRVETANGARANRFMVAARVRWPRGDYGSRYRQSAPRSILAMCYVQAR